MIKSVVGLRVALSGRCLESSKLYIVLGKCPITLEGHEDPRALRPLRGDRRIPFGFRHVLLEAASVESSGV